MLCIKKKHTIVISVDFWSENLVVLFSLIDSKHNCSNSTTYHEEIDLAIWT